MGIKGLWSSLQPCAVKRSYYEFTVNESVRKMHESHEKMDMVIGVDMRQVSRFFDFWDSSSNEITTVNFDRSLMCDCIGATMGAAKNGTVSTQFHNGALKIFFNKLCKYRKGAAVLLFVMDGDQRPNVKRSTRVVMRDFPWTGLAVDLVHNFGFHYYKAPGEAEAELAFLNRCGYIDAILTGDSDTVVFGGSCILRSLPRARREEYEDEIEVYTSDNIRNNLSMTRGGLLLYALLAGGDYDNGVDCCGKTVSLGLAKCDLGDALLDVLERCENTEKFTSNFNKRICHELRTNSQGNLDTRHPAAAKFFPKDFPSSRVVELYHRPVTSWSPGQNIPACTDWVSHTPNIAQITDFCAVHFGWNTEEVIKKELLSHVWEGVVAEMQFSQSIDYNPINKTLTAATDDVWVEVIDATTKTRTGQLSDLGRQPRLELSVRRLVELTGRGYKTEKLKTLHMWGVEEFLPANIIISEPKSKKKKANAARTQRTSTSNGKVKGKAKNKVAGSSSSDGMERYQWPWVGTPEPSEPAEMVLASDLTMAEPPNHPAQPNEYASLLDRLLAELEADQPPHLNNEAAPPQNTQLLDHMNLTAGQDGPPTRLPANEQRVIAEIDISDDEGVPQPTDPHWLGSFDLTVETSPPSRVPTPDRRLIARIDLTGEGWSDSSESRHLEGWEMGEVIEEGDGEADNEAMDVAEAAEVADDLVLE